LEFTKSQLLPNRRVESIAYMYGYSQ